MGMIPSLSMANAKAKKSAEGGVIRAAVMPGFSEQACPEFDRRASGWMEAMWLLSHMQLIESKILKVKSIFFSWNDYKRPAGFSESNDKPVNLRDGECYNPATL